LVSSIAVGFVLAAGNSVLAIATARAAASKPVQTAAVMTIGSMGVRLPVMMLLIWLLLRTGYQALPLMISFLITYTIFVVLEVKLLSKGKG
jgi:hypothetical protein